MSNYSHISFNLDVTRTVAAMFAGEKEAPAEWEDVLDHGGVVSTGEMTFLDDTHEDILYSLISLDRAIDSSQRIQYLFERLVEIGFIAGVKFAIEHPHMARRVRLAQVGDGERDDEERDEE